MGLTSKLHLTFWRHRRLPVVLQTEAAECGLACLCMVAGYWGHQIDLAQLRRRFSVSLKGITFQHMMTIARGLSLQSRPLRLEAAQLGHLQLPCVLHWNSNHLVVLKSLGAVAVIHDPAQGELRLTFAQLAEHFSGYVMELLPTAEFCPRRESVPITITGLTGRLVGLHRQLLHLVLLGLVLQLCAIVMPFFLQWVVDDVLVTSDRDLLAVLGWGFLLLTVLQTAVGALRSWVAAALTANLNFQWLGNTFSHLLRLPLTYFEKRHTGDILSRFNSIQVIQQNLTTQCVEGLIDGAMAIGTLAMLLTYSRSLALMVIGAAAVYIAIRCCTFRSMREASAQQIVHGAKQQTHLLESIRSVQSVRLFDRAELRRNDWMNLLANQFNAQLHVARLDIRHQTVNSLLFGIERIGVIWFAGLAVMDARFSVGMLFAFISYKDQFSQRMISFIDKLLMLRLMRVHAERLADIVYTEPESDSADWHVHTLDPGGAPAVECRDVSFRYADGDPFVLKSLNLCIPERQCIAVTGPSGCGKTTLIKLLLGLLVPTSGEILIGGVPLRPDTAAHCRSRMAAVMQGDQLFAGSVADNISFFDTAPDFSRMHHCARQAAIHDEIIAMPMGYNTLVGDIGSGLSGGQQQRLLLARALYRQPGVLILDEATSHLDLRNEKSVNTSIREIALTRIIVAHRPDTIAMAERVVTLRDGLIVQDQMRATLN